MLTQHFQLLSSQIYELQVCYTSCLTNPNYQSFLITPTPTYIKGVWKMMLVVFREVHGILRIVWDHVGLKIHKDGNQH